MDTHISRWLLDFLVRQPIHDSTLTTLLSSLPLSDTDSNLKKLLLLRKIESQISADLGPTHNLLCLLEHIEELDHRENVITIESMKRAYCAVAVHCTLKDEKNQCFEEAVKKIWSVRVGGMEKYGSVGLLSDELISWKDDFETALWDTNVRKGLVEKWKAGVGVGVVEAVRGFLEEAKEMMGPSFLDLAAQTLARDDGTLRQLFGMEETEQDIQRGTVHRRSKVRAAKQYKRLTPRTSRGVKIVDNDELSDASPHNNYGCLSTPEVKKLQENLRSSTSELQEIVKDPLPEALEMAKNVASKIDCVDKRTDEVSKSQENLRSSTSELQEIVKDPLPEALEMARNVASKIDRIDKRTDVVPVENSNIGNEGSTHQTNATKASLMERNKTARTYEWDESSDGSADLESRPHLSSLKKRLVTPLKRHENPKPSRRKRKFWSNLEEDTLRAGVQKYGMGNWKLILNIYRDIFDERTEVDLKDKWRNMTT